MTMIAPAMHSTRPRIAPTFKREADREAEVAAAWARVDAELKTLNPKAL